MTDQHIWIGTEALTGSSGGFQTVVHFTDDLSIPLAGDRALRYAAAVLTAAMRASYDAAIVNQWVHGLKREPELAYQIVVHDLQPDRAPPDLEATAPVEFEPGLVKNRETGRHRGVLRIKLTGRDDLGTLEISDARDHATNVLAAVAVSALDSSYLQFMKSIDIEGGRARAAVNDVGLWLDDGSPEPTSRRLARDLREAGVTGDMVDRARDGFYDDYRSDLELPTAQLVTDLHALGRTDLVDRAIAGEWDGNKTEADQWFRSSDGQAAAEIFKAFVRRAEGLCGEDHQHTAACIPTAPTGPAAAAGQPPKPGTRPAAKRRKKKR